MSRNSRVLFIRNLPQGAVDADLEDLGRRYGTVVRVLLIKSARQGFLEMSSFAEADEVKDNNHFILGKKVVVDYSNRQQIRPHEKGQRNKSRGSGHTSSPPRRYRARSRSRSPVRRGSRHSSLSRSSHSGYQISQLPGGVPDRLGHMVPMPSSVSGAHISSPHGGVPYVQPAVEKRVSRVLHVRDLPPDCTDQALVNAVLTLTVGEVYKTLVFQNKLQGFVEMDSFDSAMEVMESVASYPAHVNGQRVLFSYSHRQEITEDMVRPVAPTQRLPPPATMAPPPPTNGGQLYISDPHGRPTATAPQLFAFSTGIPDVVVDDRKQSDPSNAIPGYGTDQPGCVVFVSGLDEDWITANKLRSLFSNYGDVMKVKIMFKNKSSALVQLATSEQALRARKYLHRFTLRDNSISVVPSRNQSIKNPKESDNEDLNKDYTKDRVLQRFKYRDSNNLRHICAPGDVLHVSNMTKETTEKELRNFLEGTVTKSVEKVQFFKTFKQMALVKCFSIAGATELMMNRDCQELDGRRIRISFSKLSV